MKLIIYRENFENCFEKHRKLNARILVNLEQDRVCNNAFFVFLIEKNMWKSIAAISF